MPRQQYTLEFSEAQWVEIESLGFTGFQPTGSMYRDQWMAVANLADGKAWAIEQGRYDTGIDDPTWPDELRTIAEVVHKKFRPGDGQL